MKVNINYIRPTDKTGSFIRVIANVAYPHNVMDPEIHVIKRLFGEAAVIVGDADNADTYDVQVNLTPVSQLVDEVAAAYMAARDGHDRRDLVNLGQGLVIHSSAVGEVYAQIRAIAYVVGGDPTLETWGDLLGGIKHTIANAFLSVPDIETLEYDTACMKAARAIIGSGTDNG